MGKKKKYKMSTTGPVGGYYGMHRYNWATGSVPDKNNVITLRHGFRTCRETITAGLFEPTRSNAGVDLQHPVLILAMSPNRHYDRNGYQEPTEKDQQLCRDRMEKGTAKAVEILHIIERHYKWRRTRLEDFDTSAVRGKVVAKKINGSPNWFRSPHMLSLYMLIIRSSANCVIHKSENSRPLRKLPAGASYDELVNTISELKTSAMDLNDLRQTVSSWPIIFGKFRALFRNLPALFNFDRETYLTPANGYFHGDEGILKLLRGRSCNKKLAEKFRELKEDHIKEMRRLQAASTREIKAEKAAGGAV